MRKVADDAGVPVHLDGARLVQRRGRGRGRRPGVRARGRHGDVLRLEGTRRADRVAALRSCRPDARGAAPVDPVRGRLAPGGHHRGRRHRRARHGPERLHEDHERARRLAEGVAERLPGSIDLDQVETNMVLVDTEAVGLGLLETLERLEALGVGATHTGRQVRMVTHVDVSDDGVDVALDAWASVAAARVIGRRAVRRRSDGPVHEELPARDRPAHPAGPAAREDMAGAALRADPELRRHELGPRGLRPRREPVPARLRGAAGACRTSRSMPTCTA